MSRMGACGGWAGVLLVLLAAPWCPAQAPFLPIDPMPTEMESRIYGALESPTDIELVDTPLGDAVDYLANLHDVSIMVDGPALEAAGIRGDAAVTFAAKGIRLRSALRLMLDKLHLTYAIHNEVLLITTPAAAREMASTRVYDISKILALGDSAENLARTLTEILAADREPAFAVAGAPPVMTPDQVLAALRSRAEQSARSITAYQQMLIVRDTTTGHEQITDTLRALQASVIRQALELQRAQEEALKSANPMLPQTEPGESQPKPMNERPEPDSPRTST